MGQVIKMAKYRHPIPRWVWDHNILVTHSLPDGFNAELAKALGIDECQSAMGHAAALKRIFAIRVEDLAAILLETGRRFGNEKRWGLCCPGLSCELTVCWIAGVWNGLWP